MVAKKKPATEEVASTGGGWGSPNTQGEAKAPLTQQEQTQLWSSVPPAGDEAARREAQGEPTGVASAFQQEVEEQVSTEDTGFTTDTASGQPAPEPTLTPEEQAVATEEQAKVATSRRKKKAEEQKAAEAAAANGDDGGAVNMTNMRSDLVHGVEQIERIREEVGQLKDDEGEFFAELKAKGYSVSIVRKVIARRAMDPDKRNEQDSLISLYEEALAGV